ncbi:MerR family transcriptional regulator [Ramlibacter rhizophilus]|uniref:MerR family transcriptional regulator n=1 Tax=Ramlibacter rhizophilus TaxID=1781167 RepID=A0A4Z0BZ54_9BURK|nr:MerR family transcriptional regulator [Ramlibacter rhizophilus]TFZ03295.1 MerR family transcriptional regulator [Ramlibacter rhizophilus]
MEIEPDFTIAAVEREVGVSKDVLRVWERRYGFPRPTRDAHGERMYPAEQVRRLRLVKRLMDQGGRPGRLLGQSVEELTALASCRMTPQAPDAAGPADDATRVLMAHLHRHDAQALRQQLQQTLARDGLSRFVQDTMVPLAASVGEAWARGELEVFEEHLFTEATQRLLRQAIAAVPPGERPIVLLTTVPDEPHGLGLLMVEATLALQGAHCISLGTQMPVQDIVRAAQAYKADVVALSFSSGFGARRIPALLQQLRQLLPASVQLWAGGAGVGRIAPVEGVQLLASLEGASEALARWRTVATRGSA